MRGGTTAEKMKYWLFSDRIPVTKSVALANLVTGILIFFSSSLGLVADRLLVFHSGSLLITPWTLFTFPLVGDLFNYMGLAFSIYWLWMAGGSLERSWGSSVYLRFFFLISAISALGLFVGSMLMRADVSAAGMWLPLGAVTVAFAMLNPEQEILFMFILPLKLKYLAIISSVAVLVSYGRGNPILGIFALAGCAAAYWYVRRGRSLSFGSPRQSGRGEVIRIYPRRSPGRKENLAGWYKNYKDRKRLKDFLNKSGFDD